MLGKFRQSGGSQLLKIHIKGQQTINPERDQ